MASTDIVKMGQMQYFGQEFKKEQDKVINTKATKATSLEGYGIADAYTKTYVDTELGKKANSATTLAGYGVTDAYTKEETNTELGKKADSASTLAGYGITDAYTATQVDTAISTAVANSQHLKKSIMTSEQKAGYEADPTTATTDVIYLFKVESAVGDDKYEEYQRIGDEFVKTGDTSVDLTDYAKTADFVYATNDDVDTAITAIFGTTQS